MEKKISYLNRNYDDYRNALIELSKTYYPDMSFNYEDASVGSWFIDLNAAVADELSYHIDRVYQETNIDSASKASSVFTIARNMGFKVPGPKGAMCEVAFRCVLPIKVSDTTTNNPDWQYAPLLKRGTKVSSGSQVFELMEDLDFKKQFNRNGASDRLIQLNRDSNKRPLSYTITKMAVVIAGETNVFKKYLAAKDIKPFMEILLPVESVMNIESIITKPGSSFQSNPRMNEFYIPEETSSTVTGVTRFFEVGSLSQQQRWGEVVENDAPQVHQFGYIYNGTTVIPTCSVTKGEWKQVKHKFVTEFTDKGYMKITFGPGIESEVDSFGNATMPFAQYQIQKMLRNDSLGYLPNEDTTIFILYRSGGGKASNVAKGAINTIAYLNAEITPTATTDDAQVMAAKVRSSISVESTMESVSGKDMPSVEELKNMMKYTVAAQERCVTVKDYLSRLALMPPKYGTPFRAGASEENNKIMLYLLGINCYGKLDASLPITLIENIQAYLSNYRGINDFVEIKSGRILNLQFEPYVIIDKEYNAADVITNIKSVIANYMDINKHQMGDDIYVGDISKEISKIEGVVNFIKMRVYNRYGQYGDEYSPDITTQATVEQASCNGSDTTESNRLELDLEASDGIIYSEGNAMLEIKNPTTDITVQFKER